MRKLIFIFGIFPLILHAQIFTYHWTVPAITAISLSGGTVTTSGSYKIHTFTTTATLTVTGSGTVQVLVVAGGGGSAYGGGGGGGALRSG